MRKEIRFTGFGGQGIILSGFIYGKAAAIFGGKNATMTQSYGPEARGGACSADVVIEDGPVSFPEVTAPEIMVVMSRDAYNTHKKHIRKGVRVFYDQDLVQVEEGLGAEFIPIPSLKIAEGLGKKIVANIVMLGALAAGSDIVPKDAVKQAILSTVPPATKELNEKAFEAGYAQAKQVLEKIKA
jgi:2-oxoglutarate ferredoxin oxidoreductase subunit gamma